jgi:hypothetical protein
MEEDTVEDIQDNSRDNIQDSLEVEVSDHKALLADSMDNTMESVTASNILVRPTTS